METKRRKVEILPAIQAKTGVEFWEQVRSVRIACSLVHVKIHDGKMCPNATWNNPVSVGIMNLLVDYGLDLVVQDPISTIEWWVRRVPRTKLAIVQAEAFMENGRQIDEVGLVELCSVLRNIRGMGLKAGIALNPDSGLAKIRPIFSEIDLVMIRGNVPGFTGQEFGGSQIVDKVRAMRLLSPKKQIMVDGGVTEELLDPLVSSGVNTICANELVFSAEDPAKRIAELRKKFCIN